MPFLSLFYCLNLSQFKEKYFKDFFYSSQGDDKQNQVELNFKQIK
jgi:hypothetical protein